MQPTYVYLFGKRGIYASSRTRPNFPFLATIPTVSWNRGPNSTISIYLFLCLIKRMSSLYIVTIVFENLFVDSTFQVLKEACFYYLGNHFMISTKCAGDWNIPVESRRRNKVKLHFERISHSAFICLFENHLYFSDACAIHTFRKREGMSSDSLTALLLCCIPNLFISFLLPTLKINHL